MTALLGAALLLPAVAVEVNATEPAAPTGTWLIDQPISLDGTPLTPAVSPPPAASGDPHAPGTAAGGVGFSFKTTDFELRDLPDDQRPFYSTTVMPITDTGVHDANGVRMYRIGTRLYNHPLAQAHYGLQLLNSLVATGDQRYMDRAVAQAERLIDTAVSARGAWYFPYPFDFALHGDPNNVIRAPWYSAMAQGEALALFVWLHQLTGGAEYLSAADLAFNTFRNPRSSGSPWTVFVDNGGHLWFEEYAHDPPDRTFNGHNFALFGVQYYFALTGDADAALLLRGALTTAGHYAPVIRSPFGPSRYCVSHDVHDNYYHLVNTGQLLTDYRITGASPFALLADRFIDDLPDYRVTGNVTVVDGKHTGYKWGSDGRVTARRTVSYAADALLASTQRRTMGGGPVAYFLISSGPLDGYWLPEVAGRSFVAGKLAQPPRYVPPLPITVRRGRHVGLQFDAAGAVTHRIVAAPDMDQQLHVSERAVINGVLYRLVVDGSWAGSYLPFDQTTGAPSVTRLAGADRYATAAAIIRDRYAAPVETVYVATGEGFADALAAGPLAANAGAPILLVARDRIPAPTASELRRLAPARIVVLGGAGAVSAAIVSQLRGYTGDGVTRLAGADRYATARAVSRSTFEPGVRVAYVASGASFPDALSAGPLAAKMGGPILLSQPDHLPAATADELARLQPARIVIIGGSGVISGSVAKELGAYTTGRVVRLAGRNRYETAAAVSRSLTGKAAPDEAFLATGLGFADTLVVGPVAGAAGSPILLTDPASLPAATADELRRLQLAALTAVGGKGVVSPAVLDAVLRLWR